MSLAPQRLVDRGGELVAGQADVEHDRLWRPRTAGRGAARGTPGARRATRSPSQTPSPSTKPESKTDTTARSRGISSPLTQIRIVGVARVVGVVVGAVWPCAPP